MMTIEPDPTLTGAAFELANAGYVPMPDPEQKRDEEAIGSDSASLHEVAAQRSGSLHDPIIKQYVDQEGKPLAPNQAVTLERAARDYVNLTAAERLADESTTSTELAAHVDALRAEALASDPDAAEFYGFEPPEEAADLTGADLTGSQKTETMPSDPVDERAPSALDPDLEKALQHPQVRQAIDEKLGEAERTRQDYLNGLAAATQMAQVSFLGQFPELASIPPEILPATLEQMSRQDPQKFARVQAMVATTEQLFAQQQQESRRQTEVTRQNFLEFATSEDARLETMLNGEPKAIQHAVTTEIFASAKASGVEPTELLRLFDSEPLMRNAVFQRMMYDAGKYRLMMKAKDAVATKPVPPVQRPGLARTPAEREHADLRTLNARLSSSGNIKDAVALYNARKSSRR
jgi:hypothetical protein